MKKYIMWMGLVLMQISIFSQTSQTDSIKVDISYSQLIKANKLLTELEGLREINKEQDSVIHYKNIESNMWQYGFKKCQQANDTLNTIVIPRYEDMLSNREGVIKKNNAEISKYKFRSGVLTISLPITFVFSFAIGIVVGMHLIH